MLVFIFLVVIFVQHIFWSLKATLARKHYTPHMVARLALNELAILLGYEQLEWYMQYGVLYVELPQQSDIITVFTHKWPWIAHINARLAEYTTRLQVRDIRHKKLRPSEWNSDGFY